MLNVPDLFLMLLSNWLTFLITLVVIIIIYVTRGKTYWESRGVPQEKPLPIIGNFKKVILGKANLATLLSEMYDKFDAPYFGMSILSKNMLVVKDTEIIKDIFVKDFNAFANRDFASDEKIDPVFFNALAATPNPRWKPLRSVVSPIFTSGKIKAMFNLIKTCGEALENHIECNAKKNLEVKNVCSRYITDVISSCVFGIDANSFRHDNPEFFKCCSRIFDINLKNSFVQFCYFFLPQLVKWFKLKFFDVKSAQFLIDAFWKTVEKRKRTGIIRNDFVDILMRVKEERKDDKLLNFDDNAVASQAVVFVSAGQETSSSLMSFALYELALHPKIQETSRQEILTTIAKHGNLTYEGVNDIKYLDLVLQETLRKYNKAPYLSRISTKTYTFQKTGMSIEKGVSIIIPIQALHYDEKYFPNPKAFDPERFHPDNKHRITSFSYLPFGDGPRICMGARFGLLGVKTGLIYIIKNFIVDTCPETQIPLKFKTGSALNHPEKGVWLSFRKISPL